ASASLAEHFIVLSTSCMWPLLLPTRVANASSVSPCSLRYSLMVCMTVCSDFPNHMSIGSVRIFGNAAEFGFPYHRRMAQQPEFDWYLPSWMEAHGVSQADLCRATGFPK